jgi:hypothetical protein
MLKGVEMISAEQTSGKQLTFKIVCEDCGSLSIKMIHSANAPADTQIECGRCRAVRGTLQGLHALARRGKDVFEF